VQGPGLFQTEASWLLSEASKVLLNLRSIRGHLPQPLTPGLGLVNPPTTTRTESPRPLSGLQPCLVPLQTLTSPSPGTHKAPLSTYFDIVTTFGVVPSDKLTPTPPPHPFAAARSVDNDNPRPSRAGWSGQQLSMIHSYATLYCRRNRTYSSHLGVGSGSTAGNMPLIVVVRQSQARPVLRPTL